MHLEYDLRENKKQNENLVAALSDYKSGEKNLEEKLEEEEFCSGEVSQTLGSAELEVQ